MKGGRAEIRDRQTDTHTHTHTIKTHTHNTKRHATRTHLQAAEAKGGVALAGKDEAVGVHGGGGDRVAKCV